MEIGSLALDVLLTCWEGHLTCVETVALALKASKVLVSKKLEIFLDWIRPVWAVHFFSFEIFLNLLIARKERDREMQRAAAELALSCLNHCYSLKANDIRNALVQCRDYSPAMLEKACNAVEISALETGRDRPIPEALFETSKQWEWLFAISQLHDGDRERAQINPQHNIVNAQRPNFSFSRLDDPVQPVNQECV